MNNANSEAVRQFLQLQYEGKIDEAFSGYALEGFTWTVGSKNNQALADAIPWAGYEHKGLNGYTDLVTLLFGEYEPLVFDVEHYYDVENTVFAVGHFQFRHRETGKVADSDFIGRFDMKEGKIAGGQFYENTYAVAAGRISS